MTPDEQPLQIPEANEQKRDAAEEESGMEVNYNGHAATPESKASLESQAHGTKQSKEEQEDQENANQPENHTETHDALSSKEEHQTCNGSAEDPETELQQQQQLPASDSPASDSPASVTVELKEGQREEKKDEEMDTLGENKRGEEEDDGQNGSFKKDKSDCFSRFH